jgi:hypothetical protein
MTFLPIVDRELREGSRRRGTYWLRVRVALQALLIGVAGYVVNLINPAVKLGTVLFWGLSAVCLLFCLLAGRRSTADCLSQEKREGTLGLLFLTDLKGYDVVLGKLVATSISGFYALMAVLPVLAIPLLAGGMTNAEFWRMALVLVNTFFFSLAVGIFASALSRDYRTAMALNFFLILFLATLPAGCAMGIFIARGRWIGSLFYSCPLFSFFCCADTSYAAKTRDFWASIAFTHALAWLLFLLACWIVPRTWGDKPAMAPSRKWRWRDLGALISYGRRAKSAAFRKRALDTNAYFWLAGRARLKPAHVWTFLAGGAFWWLYGWIENGAYWTTKETCYVSAVIVNSALKLWIAQEAGQRLGEDRRAGAFELLLATPLTVGDMLRGQMLALRRQFLKPLCVVTGLELIFALVLARHWKANVLDFFTCLAGITILWADVIALPWVAMAAALTCKNQTQATLQTAARVLILPSIIFATVPASLHACYLMDLIRWQPGGGFNLGLWFGLGLAADLFFGLRAWHLLRNHFRQLAAQSFLPDRPHSLWRSLWLRAAGWAGTAAGWFIRPRARKPALACLLAAVALAVVVLMRAHPHYPPPVIVSITQSNAPLKIFPAGGDGVFFVMPDASLWRWGQTGASPSTHAAVPEQVGAARGWVKALGTGLHNVGLRSDGKVWGWGFSYGLFYSEPRPVLQGHDWIDVGTGQHSATALKSDGTLWTWNEPLIGANPRPLASLRREPGSNWTALACTVGATFALRADGTLWAWGNLGGFANGRWVTSNAPAPVLLCAETNWTELEPDLMARNRLGELWDATYSFPNASANAAGVLTLVSSNWAADHLQSAARGERAQVRADGTLWTAPFHPARGLALAPLPGDWHQLGSQTNWVSLWGQYGTGFGLTTDGTLWTWGLDLGKEPVKTFQTRLELLRRRLTGNGGPPTVVLPYSAEPRPLLKLVPSPPGPRPNQGQ